MSPNISLISSKQFKIALVAGESSGDKLGGPLINSLKTHFPKAQFIGVGGPHMIKEGLDSIFSLDRISVMGFIEPLLKLPDLLKLRRRLKKYLLDNQPDIFIGIDSPDFNLSLAKFLRRKLNIKTVQYVSPSVWAWRKGRIKTIEKSVDKVLTLFPFEEISYKDSSVEVSYVGHPLAHIMNPLPNKEKLKAKRGFKRDEKVIALLPGSRSSEISIMSGIIIKAAELIKEKDSSIRFLMPLIDQEHKLLIPEDVNTEFINFSYGDSHEVLSLSDMGIVTSGTASLEALLARTPVIVAYKTNWINYALIKPFLNISHISLPNLLANTNLLPELVQGEATPRNIFEAYKKFDGEKINKCLKEFEKIHEELKEGGPKKASEIIVDLLT